MAKTRQNYVCSACGSVMSKWSGQCPECEAWNTISEQQAPAMQSRHGHYAGSTLAIQSIAEVKLDEKPRTSTGMTEFDHVLGGGIVPGSVVLIGGDPGIGKSSILLQVMCHLAERESVLYVSGEESAQQIALRARRIGLPAQDLQLLTATNVMDICQSADQVQPKVMVIDSIQTMMMPTISAAPGGVSQVRESAAYLTQYAKQQGVAIFLVGHVTKTGEVAGPRVLEHIVDAVLFIEGNNDSRYRVMRAMKNRFGAVNELGIFAMTDKGMKQVKNPSAIFLSKSQDPTPGSAIMAIWEGSRPMLIEVQALVDPCQYGQPRRLAVGIDQNRLAMLLAILHRHTGMMIADQDIFVNVVGGVKVMETSADLAVLCAIISSFKHQPLPQARIIFGELGLSGEIRPVSHGQERIVAAAKQGFSSAIVPEGNKPSRAAGEIHVVPLKRINQLMDHLFSSAVAESEACNTTFE